MVVRHRILRAYDEEISLSQQFLTGKINNPRKAEKEFI